ncbi:hypothetical protein [Lactococcus fujiensis]|uniref:hypothetical protein n=1 Tax=Lactococcus fujiensis TaxID=610251 RepID=UPI0006D22B09|nr:hypothetical protein [Lactococcus fujiensis]
MDEMVLKTQQWLNKTYSGKSGYEIVKEDGKTGWSTIYSLIEGLQIELGITSLSRNFGTTTSSYFDSKITPNLKKWLLK